MSTALRPPMDLDAFLAWENRQELRYEFDGFTPLTKTGGTFAHAAIQRNLLTALANRLRGKPCRAIGSVLKLRVGGSIRYPAATVFTREGADWLGRRADADAILAMPEIGIDLPLAELYDGIDFPDPVQDD